MTTAEYKAYLASRGATTTSAPAQGKASTKAKGPSPASSLTTAAIQLLELRGWHAWRQNNAAVYDASFGGYRKGSVTLGISDVLAFHKKTARFAAVEIKVGKDKLSPEQTEFLADVIAAGGFGCECRSLDQLDRELATYLDSLTP